jgi:hypothetical protein
MMFDQYLKAAPYMRVMLNIGCLFDIPTGKYVLGKHGESILNGGLSHLTGVVGRGNTFKSTIMHYMALVCLARYRRSALSVYDTEQSLTVMRLYQLAQYINYIGGVALADEGRLHLSDLTSYLGDKYFDQIKELLAAKKKDVKGNMRTTPFLDKDGETLMRCLYPTLFEVDSFSMFTTAPIATMHDDNSIGESGMNTDNMRDALIKNQMLMQLPELTASSGAWMLLSAHVGDGIPLNPKAPPPKKLAFLKGDAKFKNVPEKFTFLVNNCWFCMSTKVLQADDKSAEFPANPGDTVKGDTDLQAITVSNLRAKSGPTGFQFELIVSQREGLLVTLTELNFLKTMGRYGLGGNVQTYFLELYPDVALSRTKLRAKFREDAKLRRAMEITSEMCQMENLWHDLEPGLLCTPKQLYDDLKAKGYDWDVLLQTRGYWIFEEDADITPEKFCSTMDLLRMRQGLYHPYWMEPLAKAA